MSKIMIALPGDRYFEVPRDVLEKYAVPKGVFDATIAEKWRTGDTVFHSDVEGQEYGGPTPDDAADKPVVLGVRG